MRGPKEMRACVVKNVCVSKEMDKEVRDTMEGWIRARGKNANR